MLLVKKVVIGKRTVDRITPVSEHRPLSELTSHGRSPRITFGIIVLNGEPFTRYCLRSLYPWAHEIIVVEGACPGASTVATPDGHSTDETIDVVRTFMQSEDPDDKVHLVTAEDAGHPNGFWPEKDAMSQAYAARATGNYIWQVDIDEFYSSHTFSVIYDYLLESYDAVVIPTRTYWGALDVEVDTYYHKVYDQGDFRRVFAWHPEFHYATHRPPTVLDANGISANHKRVVTARMLRAKGAFLHHYALLFPHQVGAKGAYYDNAPWARGREMMRWTNSCYLGLQNPFRVHNVVNHISWLHRFTGEHPEDIQRMWHCIEQGLHPAVSVRPMGDVSKLLKSPLYLLATAGLRVAAPPIRCMRLLKQKLFPKSSLGSRT